MALQVSFKECGLNLNREFQELQPHGTFEFPCAGYASYHREERDDEIPWHWHHELEFIYIADGKMNVKTPGESYILEKGDLIAINSNVLHYACAIGESKLRSLVFSPKLIAGDHDFIFNKKYIEPLISCKSFTSLFIDSQEKDVAAWFNCALEALDQEDFGFEFVVRDNLSRICLFLYAHYKDQIAQGDLPLNKDSVRIFQMLDFIHRYYEIGMTLADIAKVADISEREALRCFKKTIQISPKQYLLKYRLMKGAQLLVDDLEKSISDIALFCCFESPSNFSKHFQKYYQCTPREYRKKHQNKACISADEILKKVFEK